MTYGVKSARRTDRAAKGVAAGRRRTDWLSVVPVELVWHLVLPRAADPAVPKERVGSSDQQEIRNVLEGGGQRDGPARECVVVLGLTGFKPPFPPAVANRLLFKSALTAAIA